MSFIIIFGTLLFPIIWTLETEMYSRPAFIVNVTVQYWSHANTANTVIAAIIYRSQSQYKKTYQGLETNRYSRSDRPLLHKHSVSKSMNQWINQTNNDHHHFRLPRWHAQLDLQRHTGERTSNERTDNQSEIRTVGHITAQSINHKTQKYMHGWARSNTQSLHQSINWSIDWSLVYFFVQNNS